MRVIAGSARGLKLNTIESMDTRPTKDMVREALFSIIMQEVYDSTFLDLFAGSGAIGIEALSRGASKAYFCDQNPKCIKVINDNLTRARLNDKSVVKLCTYEKMLSNCTKEQFDIIFIDPPYHKGLGLEAIKQISNLNLLKKNGIIIFETDEDEDAPDTIENFEKFKVKKYGRNILNLYSQKG